jgi:hypothetical protein
MNSISTNFEFGLTRIRRISSNFDEMRRICNPAHRAFLPFASSGSRSHAPPRNPYPQSTMRPSMMRSAARLLRRRRSYSSASGQPERKVAILGAAGGIGQPLALLMKLNPLVSSLSLYDIAGTPGVAADVSHINSPALVPPSSRSIQSDLFFCC